MKGLGSWLNTESLLAVGGAQENTPSFVCTHEVVRGVEARRLLLAPLDLPRDVCDSEALALKNKRGWLELGGNIAILSIERAKRDHVLANGRECWPVLVACVVRDARRNSV